MSKKKQQGFIKESEASPVMKAARSDILIERDGKITFVSLFADLIPVAMALDPEKGKRLREMMEGLHTHEMS